MPHPQLATEIGHPWIAWRLLGIVAALAADAPEITAAVVVALYVVVPGTGGKGLRLPARWRAGLRSAVAEEELELEKAIRPRAGGGGPMRPRPLGR